MGDEWVLATRNPHKVAEVQAIVGEALRLVALPADMPEAEEPHDSLYGNALAKAAFYGRLVGRPVLAEDSGLFVVALGGQPGVFSARYGGPLRLLQAMEGVALRRAYFVAVVVAWWSSTQYRFFTGYLPGSVAEAPRGEGGFGYDPIFLPVGESRTVAELGEVWKRCHSHRAQAFHKALAHLTTAR